MRDLILETVNDICDKEGIDLDDLSDEEILKLHERGERQLVGRFADIGDMKRKEDYDIS